MPVFVQKIKGNVKILYKNSNPCVAKSHLSADISYNIQNIALFYQKAVIMVRFFEHKLT